jgi:hypothetical protein
VISDPSTGASPSPTPDQTVDPVLSQSVLDNIKTQMNNRGYSQVPSDGSVQPDLFLEVSKMTTVYTEVYYSSWPTYWGASYAPYYGASYGAGWAPYSVPYVTSATLGSLIINATNPKNPDPATKQIPVAWTAVLNGIIDNSSTADLQQRTTTGIQQAFAQSPYFTRKSQ